MPLIALASVNGSPGVTMTALALAAASPQQRRLLLEADPAGGDLGPWLDLPPAPGLVGLAAAARHETGGVIVWQHAQEISDGLHAVVAPVGAEQASACLTSLTAAPITAPSDPVPLVIADCGRLDPGSPALSIARQADLTLLLVRPHLSDLSHLAPRIAGLSRAGLRLGLLLAPARRVPAEAVYTAQEITATLDLPVRASIPADPRAVAQLISSRGAAGRPARRRPLLAAAAGLAAALASQPPARPLPGGMTAGDDSSVTEVTAGDQRS